MDSSAQHHLTLKILIGSAWADGVLKPEEEEYLAVLLQRYGEEYDRELKHLLAKPVSLQLTERWMTEYLYDSTAEERQQLLGAIGTMMFADRNISEEEHLLLDDFHAMMADIPAHAEAPELVKSIGRFVKSAIGKVTGHPSA
ncbi:TerB family tellurite resistance protein [Synechococcus sp. PCC 7336]|uniref:tellurite resistance TerB family protein n=1 Tax=Synechococcus sp. PCC 7336 TaxID=195250 RepID=UPI00034BACDB|nr:TerB family tellurite resistance protein [Synechococcus sp. PCC 7336]